MSCFGVLATKSILFYPTKIHFDMEFAHNGIERCLFGFVFFQYHSFELRT
jgi:hypothetical protein